MSQIYKQPAGTPGAAPVEFLNGNSGGKVGPDGTGTINVIGAGSLTFAGNPGTNTETAHIEGATGTLLAGLGATDAAFQTFLNGSFTFQNSGTASTNRTLSVVSTDAVAGSDVTLNLSTINVAGTGTAAIVLNNNSQLWRIAGQDNNATDLVISPDNTGAFPIVQIDPTGIFELEAGFINSAITQPGGDYLLTATDFFVWPQAASSTMTLPASPEDGRVYIIGDDHGVSFPITISGNGHSINGNSTYVLTNPFECAILAYTPNTSWTVIGTANRNPFFNWTNVTGATQTLATNNNYVTNHTNVTYTLPATAVFGDEIKIVGKLGITTIAQNANQQILISSSSSTVGVGGSVAGTNVGDCIDLICITAGASTVWRALGVVGNWTVV